MLNGGVKKTAKPIIFLVLLIFIGFLTSLVTPIISNDTKVYAKTPECKTPEYENGKLKNLNLDKTTPIECFSTGRSSCNVISMGVFVCGVTFILTKLVDGAFYIIKPLLEIQSINKDTRGGQFLYSIWNNFRNIANVAFVIMLLLIVYSQVTGGGLTNYTIKRALPRLIVNIILINLSYFICIALIEVFNIAGSSLKHMMDIISNITSFNLEFDLVSNVAYTFLGAAAFGGGLFIATFVAGFIVPFFTMGLLLLITVILILGLRYALVIMLVIISPLAFALNIFPNTQKFFSKWWKAFIIAGMMYPVIAFLAGSGTLLSNIIKAGSTNGNSINDFIFSILGVAAQVMPLILIPKTIKYASGALGAISGAASKFTDKTAGQALNNVNRKAIFLQKKANVNAEKDKGSKRGAVLRRISASRGKDAEAQRQAEGSGYGQGMGPTAMDSYLAQNSEDIANLATLGDVDSSNGSVSKNRGQIESQVRNLDPGGTEYSGNPNENNAGNNPNINVDSSQAGYIRQVIALAGIEIGELELENRNSGISAEQTRLGIINDTSGKYDQATQAAAIKRQFENSNFDDQIQLLKNNSNSSVYIKQALTMALSGSGGALYDSKIINEASKGNIFNGNIESQLAHSFAENASTSSVGDLNTQQMKLIEQEVRKLEAQNTTESNKIANKIKQKIKDAYQDDSIRAKMSTSTRKSAKRII